MIGRHCLEMSSEFRNVLVLYLKILDEGNDTICRCILQFFLVLHIVTHKTHPKRSSAHRTQVGLNSSNRSSIASSALTALQEGKQAEQIYTRDTNQCLIENLMHCTLPSADAEDTCS
jgi:hypothetical protein